MNSKRKLIISMLVIAFILLSIIATVAIVFALTQQTIKTALNISYKAEDIDATVSAKMTYQTGVTEDLGSITFEAGNATAETGSLSPQNNIELSTNDQYVIFEYTFKNTGEKDFVAIFNYTDTEETDQNMSFGYKGNAESYKETANAILINGGETKTYYVKISIENLAKNAHLSGDILWDMTSNIVVANPNNAQEVLDSNINDKTVVFTAGTYNENLILRPSYLTAIVEDQAGNSVVVDNLIDSTSYSYTRNIDNVTFTAVDGAVFTKTFLSDGVEVNSDMSWFTPFASETYDAVKQKTLSESATYKKNMHLNNVEIYGFEFHGGRIFINMGTTVNSVTNLLIQNCKFVSNSDDIFYQDANKTWYNVGIEILNNPSNNFNANNNNESSYQGMLKNTNIKNNVIDNYFQGIYLSQSNNVTISNNVIKNTTHNAIALQSDAGSGLPTYFSQGTFIIAGNKISNISDRAIRFGVVSSNSQINVLDNVFENCTDNGSLLKTQKPYYYFAYTFENNTYNGSKLNDAEGDISDSNWEYFVQ